MIDYRLGKPWKPNSFLDGYRSFFSGKRYGRIGIQIFWKREITSRCSTFVLRYNCTFSIVNYLSFIFCFEYNFLEAYRVGHWMKTFTNIFSTEFRGQLTPKSPLRHSTSVLKKERNTKRLTVFSKWNRTEDILIEHCTLYYYSRRDEATYLRIYVHVLVCRELFEREKERDS